jgi:hypothetical protein
MPDLLAPASASSDQTVLAPPTDYERAHAWAFQTELPRSTANTWSPASLLARLGSLASPVGRVQQATVNQPGLEYLCKLFEKVQDVLGTLLQVCHGSARLGCCAKAIAKRKSLQTQ